MIWGLLLLIIVAPFVLDRMRRDVRSARKGRGTEFLTLSQGVTHIQRFGPAEGAPLLCIHGLTTSCYVWDDMVPGLVDRGHHVITYDLYGRGLSDRPGGAQNAAFFVRQATDVLDALKITGPVTVMGYSMGGAIAAALTADQPGRVAHLVLLAPAGMGHDLGRLAKLCTRLPVIGDWLWACLYPWQHRKWVKTARRPLAADHPLPQHLAQEVTRRGYPAAILSSLKGLIGHALADEHRKIATTDIPVTAIWGAQDRVIPLWCKDQLTDWNPRAQHHVIDTAAHELGYTHAPEVLRLFDLR